MDGVPKARAAERHGLTQPRVLAIVERVLTTAHDVPRDWVRLGGVATARTGAAGAGVQAREQAKAGATSAAFDR